MRKKDYSDMIHLPHHESKRHPKMPKGDRAAQFAPFAALTGHEEAVKETARVVEQKLELDESQKMIINDQLNILKDSQDFPLITMVYFQLDQKKLGGAYVKVIDKVVKIDSFAHMIVLESGLKVLFEDIYSIDISSKNSCDWGDTVL